jgi:hypothetical protein
MSRSAVCLLLLTFVLYCSAIGARLLRYGDLSAFPAFGCATADICFARDNAPVLPPGAVIFRSGGYDGQFYYYIAAALYADRASGVAYIPALDAPAFRRARIGYPLLTGPAFYLLGPRALVAAMIGLPLLAHLFTLALLLRRYRWPIASFASWRSPPLLAAAVFAFNPVSLFCVLYTLADGLALSCMLLALCLLVGPGTERVRPTRLVAGAVLLIFAVLCKEHALAGVAGLLFGRLCSGRSGRSQAVPLILIPITATAVLAGWWAQIGFTPGLAARRGGLPFAGLWGYLQAPDAFFSGRTYLVGLLAVYLVTLALAAIRTARPWWTGGDRSAARWPAILCAICGATVALVAFATVDEYWGNYANMLRLFTPGFAALAVLPLCDWDGAANQADRATQITRAILLLALLLCLGSVYAIIDSEIAGRGGAVLGSRQFFPLR